MLLDHEMKNLEVPLDFHQSTMPQPVQSTLRFAGVTQHVTMQAQGGAIKIVGLSEPKSNRGGTSTAIEAEMARLSSENAWDGFQFSMSPVRPINERRAKVGWLRAAYLAVFAALGYRYIGRTELSPIREQIASPDSPILPSFSGINPTSDPGERHITRIDLTESVDCVAVQMGRHIIFLPGFRPGMDQYTCLESMFKKGDHFSFQGLTDLISWPKKMELVLDWLKEPTG